MLDANQLARLSPLARRFRMLFVELLPEVAHSETFTDHYELVIQAAHEEVGPLHVRDDADELTISVGAHHWHVPLYMYEEAPEPERIAQAAERAVTDVRNVLQHRTVLRVTRRDGHIVRTMSYSIDYLGVEPAAAGDSEYLWRGPRVRLL